MTVAKTQDVLASIDEELKGHHEQAYKVGLDRAKAVFDLSDSVEGEHRQCSPYLINQSYYEAQAAWIEGTGPNPDPDSESFAQIIGQHIGILERALGRSPIVQALLDRNRTPARIMLNPPRTHQHPQHLFTGLRDIINTVNELWSVEPRRIMNDTES